MKESPLIPIRKEFPYTKIRSFARANPFTIAFIYPDDELDFPFILKGGLIDINYFLDSYKIPFIGYKSFWYHSEHRGIWSTNVTGILIKHQIKPETKYEIIRYTPGRAELLKTVKRIPRKWMKELKGLSINYRG